MITANANIEIQLLATQSVLLTIKFIDFTDDPQGKKKTKQLTCHVAVCLKMFPGCQI